MKATGRPVCKVGLEPLCCRQSLASFFTFYPPSLEGIRHVLHTGYEGLILVRLTSMELISTLMLKKKEEKKKSMLLGLQGDVQAYTAWTTGTKPPPIQLVYNPVCCTYWSCSAALGQRERRKNVPRERKERKTPLLTFQSS